MDRYGHPSYIRARWSERRRRRLRVCIRSENGIAVVVTGFAHQPREDAQGIERVGDARGRVFAIEG